MSEESSNTNTPSHPGNVTKTASNSPNNDETEAFTDDLDYALLESLFYNEMVQLGDNSIFESSNDTNLDILGYNHNNTIKNTNVDILNSNYLEDNVQHQSNSSGCASQITNSLDVVSSSVWTNNCNNSLKYPSHQKSQMQLQLQTQAGLNYLSNDRAASTESLSMDQCQYSQQSLSSLPNISENSQVLSNQPDTQFVTSLNSPQEQSFMLSNNIDKSNNWNIAGAKYSQTPGGLSPTNFYRPSQTKLHHHNQSHTNNASPSFESQSSTVQYSQQQNPQQYYAQQNFPSSNQEHCQNIVNPPQSFYNTHSTYAQELPPFQQSQVNNISAPSPTFPIYYHQKQNQQNLDSYTLQQQPSSQPKQMQTFNNNSQQKYTNVHSKTIPSNEKANKLIINQFQTLASRLGISLPDNFLSSLSSRSAMNEPSTLSFSNPTTTTNSSAVPANGAPFTFENNTRKSVQSSVSNNIPSTKSALNYRSSINKSQLNSIQPIINLKLQKPQLQLEELVSPQVSSSSSCVSSKQNNTCDNPPPKMTISPPKLVKELQNAADEAIATIQERKRKPSLTNSTCQDEIDSSIPPLALSSSITSNASSTVIKRKCKKPRKEECESKLQQLKTENEMLKRHLDNVMNKSARFDHERKIAEKKMKDLVFGIQQRNNTVGIDMNTTRSPTNEKSSASKELSDIIGQFTETYSDYGKYRQQELAFHLNQLAKLAAPTNFTKMGLWTLGQKKSFFTNKNHNSIAGILRKELEITPQQGKKIIAQREKVQSLSGNVKSCLQLIAELKALCEHKQKVFNDRMTKCQEILTPEQVGKLLVWIDDNGTILESVCPGWANERIRSGKQKNGRDDESMKTK